MGAFKHFDTSAYLEDASSQPRSHTLATPATPATPATEIDGKEQTVATVATVAGGHGDNSGSLPRPTRHAGHASTASDVIAPIPEIQPKAARSEWDLETTALIEWFLGTAPPDKPFQLQQAVTIVRPAHYWEYLRRDIKAGPNRARGKTGALQDDLRRLHQLFGKDQDHACALVGAALDRLV